MRICFLDKTEFKYDYNDKYSSLSKNKEAREWKILHACVTARSVASRKVVSREG